MRVIRATKNSVELSGDPGDRYGTDGSGMSLQSLTITASDQKSQLVIDDIMLALRAKNGKIVNPFKSEPEDVLELLVDDILTCGKRSDVLKVFTGHNY